MGIQIVQHHSDHRSIWVGLIHQPPHLVGKVFHGASLGDRHVSPAGQGFAGQEDVARTGAAILVILTPRLSRLHRNGRPGVGQQLSGGLIKADHRPVRVVGLSVQVQHVLHRRHEFTPLPWGYTTAASATAGGRFFEPQPHRLMGQGLHQPQLHHSVGQKMQGSVVVAIGRWAARQGDQVGLPLVIKLPVSVGLDPILQHAI